MAEPTIDVQYNLNGLLAEPYTFTGVDINDYFDSAGIYLGGPNPPDFTIDALNLHTIDPDEPEIELNKFVSDADLEALKEDEKLRQLTQG